VRDQLPDNYGQIWSGHMPGRRSDTSWTSRESEAREPWVRLRPRRWSSEDYRRGAISLRALKQRD